MLVVKPYENLKVKNPKPPPGPDWIQQWHGYYHPPELAKTKRLPAFYNKDAHCCPPAYAGNSTGYGYLEMMGFLSILEFYDGKHFSFIELGSGIGYWCTALAAIIEYGILPKRPISYRALAVEAEATHYQWAMKNISSQGINAVVINKAVTNTIGVGLFSNEDPYLRWGQHLLRSWSVGEVKPKQATETMIKIDPLVARYQLVEVPLVATTTVDLLLDNHSFGDVSLAHLDVQAEEARVIKGASGAIRAGQIHHFIIEVHDRRNSWVIADELKHLLFPSYNLIADLPRYTTRRFDNFPDPIFGEAGMQIWQLKGL